MKVLFVGDGQLGQMLGASGISHGHECLLFSTRTQEVKPLSAHVALPWTLAEAIDWADVVSWEHEAIPADVIAAAHDKSLSRMPMLSTEAKCLVVHAIQSASLSIRADCYIRCAL